MKGLLGQYYPWRSLVYLSSKIGGLFGYGSSPNKYKKLDSKLEKKMILLKSSSEQKSFRSINSIIMSFPAFRERMKKIRSVFEQYDEDANGAIDREELDKCLQKLQVNLKEEEVNALFRSCDIDGSEGIQFNEFIVLICLIYLLMEPSSSPQSRTRMGSPELEATFDTIIEAFLFFDKNGKGKLNKTDVINALNETSPWEKSPTRISMSRFKEMDWDRNGEVTFRKFVFALINWVGIDADEEAEIPVLES